MGKDVRERDKRHGSEDKGMGREGNDRGMKTRDKRQIRERTGRHNAIGNGKG